MSDINGQPAKIKIQAQIKDDGSFSITALPQANLFTITLPNVFNLPAATDNLMSYQYNSRFTIWNWQRKVIAATTGSYFPITS